MLEAAEDVMGSTEQNLELVVINDLDGPLLSAVGSRLAFFSFSLCLFRYPGSSIPTLGLVIVSHLPPLSNLGTKTDF